MRGTFHFYIQFGYAQYFKYFILSILYVYILLNLSFIVFARFFLSNIYLLLTFVICINVLIGKNRNGGNQRGRLIHLLVGGGQKVGNKGKKIAK